MLESIGQRLKQARESRRLTIEKAAEATRIRLPYLQALENDDYSVMVSAAQGRGFLRLYADFLGLDLDAILSDMKTVSATAQPDASPAPVADAPAPTDSAPDLASSSGPKSARPGFWSRLLRRSAPAEPVPQVSDLRSETQTESLRYTPEPAASLIVEETPPAPTMAEPIAMSEPMNEEPVKPAKRTRRAASETEPKKKPRAAASKKKLLTP